MITRLYHIVYVGSVPKWCLQLHSVCTILRGDIFTSLFAHTLVDFSNALLLYKLCTNYSTHPLDQHLKLRLTPH